MDGVMPTQAADGLDIRHAVAARVRAERARRNLSQEELAHRSGLSRMHISAIERARVAVTITALAQVAKALEVPIRTLMPET